MDLGSPQGHQAEAARPLKAMPAPMSDLQTAIARSRAVLRSATTEDVEKTFKGLLDAKPSSDGLPTALWEVIDRALQKEPDRRFRNALEMAQALRDAEAPMKEHEVGSLLSTRFPRRVTEVQTWEQTSNTASKAEAALRTPTVRGQDI